MTPTFDRLRAFLIKDYRLTSEMVRMDASLYALGIDSLGMAELLFNMEDEFNITLSPDAVQLLTLGDVVRFIDELIAAQYGRKSPKERAMTPAVSPA